MLKKKLVKFFALSYCVLPININFKFSLLKIKLTPVSLSNQNSTVDVKTFYKVLKIFHLQFNNATHTLFYLIFNVSLPAEVFKYLIYLLKSI